MTVRLSPGVYIEERNSELQTVQGVGTSTGAFIGFTPMGVTDEAILATSWPDAVRKVGGLTRQSFLGYCLAAFFANGGTRAQIVRVVPSDAVAASAALRSDTTDQQIETGTGTQATFTKTATASLLKDNGGASPLVPATLGIRWRPAGTPVTSQVVRNRQNAANVTLVASTANYEGRIDPMPTLLVAGADADGGVYYRALTEGDTSVQIAHVAAAANQTLAVTVTSTRIVVTLATDGSAVVTSTAAAVAAAIAGSAPASALVTASATGAGTGLTRPCEVRALSGMQPYDSAMDAVVPGTLSITWQVSSSPVTLSFSGQTSTPIQTVTNGAGSTATVDLRTGRFSLVCAGSETPGGMDAGIALTVSYTPSAGDVGVQDDGAGALAGGALTTAGTVSYTDGSYSFTTRSAAAAHASIGAGGNGTVNITADLVGSEGNGFTVQVLGPTGTRGLSATLNATAITVNLAATAGVATAGANTATLIAAAITALPGVSATASGTGASEITTASGPTAFTGGVTERRPHNLARVLASYAINDWGLVPVSKGAWGNNLRLSLAADPTAAGLYSASIELKDTVTGVYSVVESYDELVMNDPDSPQFWADVINELSDYILVTEPGGNEVPGALVPASRRQVLGGGDGSSGGRTFSLTLAGGPITARSLTIAYTDATGVARTITDTGFGGLSGSLDAAYATVVSGLGANRVDLTTGQINFRTAVAVQPGTLVVATYTSRASVTTLRTLFGDTTAGFTAGSDGTFTAGTYGRAQLSDFAGLAPSYKGLYALSRLDEIMQVMIPDFVGDEVVSSDLIDYAELRASTNPAGADRFVILAPPKRSTPEGAVDWVLHRLNRQSKYAAVYWPWIIVNDSLTGRRLTVPPVGHIAGVYARTDASRNVGKAPAGTVDGQLSYLAGLEFSPSQGDRDTVYPAHINPLRSDAQVGTCVWGAQTLSALSSWRNVNAVRLFMFVETSVYGSTHWVVFENVGPALWNRIKLQLDGFLGNLFIDGYFAGATRAEAYSVTVDSTNNPQEVIDAGDVITDVGLAPNKPALFARFRFQQRSLA